jgi:VanZ family protein
VDHSQRYRLLSLQLPVIVLLLAFTAVPTEFRLPNWYLVRTVLSPRFAPFDVVANVVGYLPVGAVLANWTKGPMLWTVSVMSLFAEGTQVFSNGRSPSFVDVATNVLGAAIGWALCVWWNVRPRPVPVSRRTGGVAALLAVAYLAVGGAITPSDLEDTVAAFINAPPWLPVSDRGATAPGQLEGHWTLDALENATTADSSQNRLTGVVVNHPARADGMVGRAVDLNGVTQSVDLGNPIALRVIGSMTISAWIKPRDYLDNDNAVVSNLNAVGRGFQLDVTTDEGPPAIGFKLTDDAGNRMARYGATRLRRNQWYHLAGVYDARAQTLDVYLNGRPDNGCLQGRVTSRQRISGVNAFIGARSRPQSEQFTGLIDDVKIYSRALTQSELAADVEGVELPSFAIPVGGSSNEACASEVPVDGRVAGFAVALGMLVATACIGLWPTAHYRVPGHVLSLVAGIVLLVSIGSTMPVLLRWLLPLLTFAGGSAIVLSAQSPSSF